MNERYSTWLAGQREQEADRVRLDIFQALAEKLQKHGWIPAPPWWVEHHRANYVTDPAPVWDQMTSPEDKMAAWIAAPPDDYEALIEFLLERWSQTHKTDIKGREIKR